MAGALAGRGGAPRGGVTFSVTVNTITVNTSVPKVQFPNIWGQNSPRRHVKMCFPFFTPKTIRDSVSLLSHADTSEPPDLGLLHRGVPPRGQ